MNIDPMYIISRPERYAKTVVAEARDVLKARRAARDAAFNAANPPDELSVLIATARRTRSRKVLVALKAQIEAITGITYHID